MTSGNKHSGKTGSNFQTGGKCNMYTYISPIATIKASCVLYYTCITIIHVALMENGIAHGYKHMYTQLHNTHTSIHTCTFTFS